MIYAFIDEAFKENKTGVEESKERTAPWFVGALLVRGDDALLKLDNAVLNVRRKHDLTPEQPFKWSNKETQSEPEQHKKAKNAVIEAINQIEYCGVILSIGFQGMLKKPKENWNYKITIGRINKIAQHLDEQAIVVLDKFGKNDATNLGRSIYSTRIGTTSDNWRYSKIVSVSAMANHTSSFSSAADIAIGALAYAIRIRREGQIGRVAVSSLITPQQFEDSEPIRLYPKETDAQIYEDAKSEISDYLAFLNKPLSKGL